MLMSRITLNNQGDAAFTHTKNKVVYLLHSLIHQKNN